MSTFYWSLYCLQDFTGVIVLSQCCSTRHMGQKKKSTLLHEVWAEMVWQAKLSYWIYNPIIPHSGKMIHGPWTKILWDDVRSLQEVFPPDWIRCGVCNVTLRKSMPAGWNDKKEGWDGRGVKKEEPLWSAAFPGTAERLWMLFRLAMSVILLIFAFKKGHIKGSTSVTLENRWGCWKPF